MADMLFLTLILLFSLVSAGILALCRNLMETK